MARAQSCTPIATLPAVITAQGLYCLTSDADLDLATGNAITINANNVVLDLGGHKVGNLSAGAGTDADGIYSFGRQNITIRNGTLRGFLYGIFLDGTSTSSQGHLVEGIRIDQSTLGGIFALGQGIVVRDNRIVATGGATGRGTNVNAFGLVIHGPANRAIDNDIVTVAGQGTGVGWGVFLGSATDALLVNNRIADADRGIEFASSTGKYRDNFTAGVATPYASSGSGAGGTDAGNNN